MEYLKYYPVVNEHVFVLITSMLVIPSEYSDKTSSNDYLLLEFSARTTQE